MSIEDAIQSAVRSALRDELRPALRELLAELRPAAAVDEGLWTVRDVAKYLRVSRSWVYQHQESLHCLHLHGASVRFEPAKVRAFAMGSARAPAAILNITARGAK